MTIFQNKADNEGPWDVDDDGTHSYVQRAYPSPLRNGAKVWLNKNGELHREDDKPARIYPDGTREWFKNGVQYFPYHIIFKEK